MSESTSYGNQFLNGYEVPVAAEAAYTVAFSVSRVVIGNAVVHNYGPDTETLTLWMLPEGEALADNYKAIVALPIGPNSEVNLSQIIGEPLLAGGTIQAQATTPGTLSLTIGGSVVTPN